MRYFLFLVLYRGPEDPALQNIIFLNFFFFGGNFCLRYNSDPDPENYVKHTIIPLVFSGYLKGHGKETNFSLFSYKSVRSLTQLFHLFGFGV
jgi:hypothetical protein